MTLLDLATGRPFRPEDDGRARRAQLITLALLAAVAAAAVWGLAAGSRSPAMAIANLYKVPMVVVLSSLAAVPGGLLAWKLSGSTMRPSDLLVSFATSVMAGTLVMAVLAPLLALYYQTSAWAGPLLGLGTTFSALTVGTVTFFGGVLRRAPKEMKRSKVLWPAAVIAALQIATLVQFIAVASPIMPENTVFDGGIDQMVGH
ncbi:MAG: hypothetical protein U1E65_25510 [Myxococcota bacterium]